MQKEKQGETAHERRLFSDCVFCDLSLGLLAVVNPGSAMLDEQNRHLVLLATNPVHQSGYGRGDPSDSNGVAKRGENRNP